MNINFLFLPTVNASVISWCCVFITPVQNGWDKQILRALWQASLAKLVSFNFNETLRKTEPKRWEAVEKENQHWSPASTWEGICKWAHTHMHMHVCIHHTHLHICIHTLHTCTYVNATQMYTYAYLYYMNTQIRYTLNLLSSFSKNVSLGVGIWA